MGDSLNFTGARFDDPYSYPHEYYIQSINQHDLGCQTNHLPLNLCQHCGPLGPLYNGGPSFNMYGFQSDYQHQHGSQYTGMTYAQAVATPQATPPSSRPGPTHVQPPLAFPPLGAGAHTLPTSHAGRNVVGPTYAQVAQGATHIDRQRQQAPQIYPHASQTTGPTQIVDQAPQQPNHASRTTIHQRRHPAQRRPSRAFHTALTIELLQDVSHLSGSGTPLLMQPEVNPDPRSVSTFVQRTQRGAHRQSFSSSAGPSDTSSPVAPGTLSAASSNRSRRKGEAMRDPMLPFECPFCGKTFYNQDDHKRHITRTHGNIEDRPHRCREPGCNMAFIHPKDRLRHEATHQPPARLPCPHPECGKVFTRQDNLNRHVRDFHRIDSAIASSTSTSRRGSSAALQLGQSF